MVDPTFAFSRRNNAGYRSINRRWLSPSRSATRRIRSSRSMGCSLFCRIRKNIVHAADTIFDRSRLCVVQTVLDGKIQQARRRLSSRAEAFRPFLPHIVSGSSPCRQRDDLHARPAVHEQIQPSQCGTHPGLIRIEQQHDLRSKPSNELNVLGRQCRPQRRNRVRNPRLVKRDRIKIPFHHDHGFQPSYRFPRKIQRVERLPLLEKRSIRRIQIFGSPSPKIRPPKPTIRLRRSVIGNMTRVLNLSKNPIVPFRCPSLTGSREPTRPAAARSPDANPFLLRALMSPSRSLNARPIPNRMIVALLNAPLTKIVACRLSKFFLKKILLKPSCGHLIDLLDPPKLRGLLTDPCRFLNLDSHLSTEITHHLGKACAGDPGQEREDIAAGPAGETMENLFRGTNGERGVLILMEGTQALEVLTDSGQGDVVTHDVCDIDPFSDLINEVIRNQASTHGCHSSRHASVRSEKDDRNPLTHK